MRISEEEYLEHYGVKGMKWGVINEDDRIESKNAVRRKRLERYLEEPYKINAMKNGSYWRAQNRKQAERGLFENRRRREQEHERWREELHREEIKKNPDIAIEDAGRVLAKDYFIDNPGKEVFYYQSSSDKGDGLLYYRIPETEGFPKGTSMGPYRSSDIIFFIREIGIHDIPPSLLKEAIGVFPEVKKLYTGAKYIEDKMNEKSK